MLYGNEYLKIEQPQYLIQYTKLHFLHSLPNINAITLT